ncbi:hypothetical protein OGATHE_006691 [Ogataea polymorpha]|uniref:Uncharacterized protein n=1 Tax=Ogataea polymorpha TaxID=460523 RepID=A0A9P8NSC8_9ASCO|nr:hypothetical protein OGATHE_006691 [Ogataea polymorpha]
MSPLLIPFRSKGKWFSKSSLANHPVDNSKLRSGAFQFSLGTDRGGGADGFVRGLGGDGGVDVPDDRAEERDLGGVGGLGDDLELERFRFSKLEDRFLENESVVGLRLIDGLGGGSLDLSSSTTAELVEGVGRRGSGGASSSSTEDTDSVREGRNGSGGASSSSEETGLGEETGDAGGGGNLDTVAVYSSLVERSGFGGCADAGISEVGDTVFVRLFFNGDDAFNSDFESSKAVAESCGFLAFTGGGIFGFGLRAGFPDDIGKSTEGPNSTRISVSELFGCEELEKLVAQPCFEV